MPDLKTTISPANQQLFQLPQSSYLSDLHLYHQSAMCAYQVIENFGEYNQDKTLDEINEIGHIGHKFDNNKF